MKVGQRSVSLDLGDVAMAIVEQEQSGGKWGMWASKGQRKSTHPVVDGHDINSNFSARLLKEGMQINITISILKYF